MKLKVDFTELEAAVRKMGAAPVTFDVQRQLLPTSRIAIELEAGIEISSWDEVDTRSGLLAYQGHQILLYIQDHGTGVAAALADPTAGRKFHVTDCRTLQQMRDDGRWDRFVVTNKLDGSFLISGYDRETGQELEGYAALRVCKNCLSALRYKGAVDSTSRGRLADAFNLGEFFSTYSSFFKYLPSRHAGEPSGYTDDWGAVAARVKVSRHYRCEQCGVVLDQYRKWLHVHHVNGVKADNRESNLRVLCVSCHRQQPKHERLFVPHQATKLINRLRREQAVASPSDWDDAMRFVDAALYGLLHGCRAEGADAPEIGLDVQNARHEIVAALEVAWPSKRVALAISEEDAAAAAELGWEIWGHGEALRDLSTFVARVKR